MRLMRLIWSASTRDGGARDWRLPASVRRPAPGRSERPAQPSAAGSGHVLTAATTGAQKPVLQWPRQSSVSSSPVASAVARRRSVAGLAIDRPHACAWPGARGRVAPCESTADRSTALSRHRSGWWLASPPVPAATLTKASTLCWKIRPTRSRS